MPRLLVLLAMLTLFFVPKSAWAKDGPIGLSLAQLSRGGLESIPMPPAHPVNGQPRLSGISSDKMTLFEIVGDPRNVRLATVAVMLSNDSTQVTRAARLLAQFMKNASPGWNQGSAWLIASVRQALKAPGKEVVAVRDNRRYELFYSKDLSNLMLTVEHR